MIKMTTDIKLEKRRLREAARKGSLRSLSRAAFVLGGTAKDLFKWQGKRKKGGGDRKPSAPGSPPITRGGRLPRAIRYDVDREREEAVIGPEKSKAGTVGMAHEHGVRYKGKRYPKRAFMGPALEKIESRLAGYWAGSVK